MATVAFFSFLGVAVLLALLDWRRGWYLAVLVGLLQDPARKLTANTPVFMTFSIVAVYAAVLFSAYGVMVAHRRDFSRRFPALYAGVAAVLFVLGLAAVNGLLSYELEYWTVPFLSLFTYLAPIPAILFGYAFVQREETLYRFFRFYAIATSIMMIGCVLEYFRVESAALGMVATQGDYIRHLPGIQIRMLSGFYRAPDVMAWHAGTLTAISMAMALRAGVSARAYPWLLATAWGFLNCLISGRRKATYYVIAFVAVFVWRYFRRMTMAQLIASGFAAILLTGIFLNLSEDKEANVYTRGATASRGEILQRLEGGVADTFRQYGLMGAGLGAATQGTQHLLRGRSNLGWQEGGLGKLAVELGLPGLLALTLVGRLLIVTFLRLTSIGDVPGSSQIMRATLLGLIAANVANFLGSAQAYSDPVLALLTAFFVGALFATATLDERLAAEQQQNAAAVVAQQPLPAVGLS
jgi:uncharacterized membrane-anchored protein YitT (DUF2179 family)